jgi:hypothetical protein
LAVLNHLEEATMNCDTFLSQFDAYADGALSPSERALMEVHRARCAACQSAAEQARRLDALLRGELPQLAAATPAEQVMLRGRVGHELGLPGAWKGQRWPLRALRLIGAGAVLALALLLFAILLPGERQTVSAAEIVRRASNTVENHQGMSGVLHWEGEWREYYPGGDQITRTFEILFDFDDPGRYRFTQRNPDGRVIQEMVRDGVDRMWQLSRSVTSDGREATRVDEIVLSPQEMEELASWLVPSPFLDDLDRFTDVLGDVERVAEIEIAGRSAFVLRGQLFGFGQPGAGNRIDPVTSTVQLLIDADSYWVLGRIERLPGVGGAGGTVAGTVQRTRRFELLPLEQVPQDAFSFSPPPGAEVRTVNGIAGYYAPTPDAIGLDEAVQLTSFTLVLPSRLPGDLQPRPFFQYQGPGPAATFSIVYLGTLGRQAFLLEHQEALPLARATRMVQVGQKRAWLAPDPIDGRKFSLYLIDPQPDQGPDGRPWPGGIELQVWGMSVDEAVGMLASLQPYAD